jgi:Protein of unknown function (DUF3052)
MAGYSGTPLVQKLGIKAGHSVALLQAPADFLELLGALPGDVRVEHALARKKPFDLIVLFAMAERDLARRFASAAKRLEPHGGLWVAWPKRASGVATDVTENAVRGVALAAGLVDNKVCAVDETWSALRCVIRVANRPRPSRTSRPQAR